MFRTPSRALACLVLIAAAAMTSPAWAQGTTSKNRVVLQVSDADPQKWNLALDNARNLQQALGGSKAVAVEIVAYGPGIGMLEADSPVGQRVADALKAGVDVDACQNTMRNHKLVPADMLSAIGYVPSGVVEIMKKQQEGYAYIRP